MSENKEMTVSKGGLGPTEGCLKPKRVENHCCKVSLCPTICLDIRNLVIKP